MNRNTERKLKKKARKLMRSKIDLQMHIAHSGSKKMSGNVLNGLINLENKKRLHLLPIILDIHRATV